MRTEVAKHLISVSLNCSRQLDDSVELILCTCDEAHFLMYRRLAGLAMGYIFTDVLAPIYNSIPDLAPEWMEMPATNEPQTHSVQSRLASHVWSPSGPMQRKTAEAVVVTLGEVAYELEKLMAYIREHCDPDEALSYCEGIKEVLEHLPSAEQMIFDEHPDLKR
jgi:hypothetical protein